MERRTFTIDQIRDRVADAIYSDRKKPYEGSKHPLSLDHLVYMAERKARERSNGHWEVPISLDPQNPPRYDMGHSAGILDELAEMTHKDTDQRVQSLYSLGVTQDSIDEAEMALLRQQNTQDAEYQKRLPESTEQEIVDMREPYPFRGHHLVFTKDLLRFHPAIAAEKIAAGQRRCYENQSNRVAYRPELYTDAALEYPYDVMGNTREETDNWEDVQKKEFQEFIDLPDDYPVEILTGMQDKICDSCVIGQHCTVKTSAVRGTSMIDHDRAVAAVFVNEAREMGLEDDLRVVTKTASFSDAPDEEVEAIRTTVGTIKKVMRTSNVDWVDIYNVVPLAELWLKDRSKV